MPIHGDYGQPNPKRAHEEFWVGWATATSAPWIGWTIPKWASYLDIVLIGDGAGGGAGLSATSAAAGGGGGGGSGALTRMIVPVRFLPRTLYMLLGSGGLGGSTSAAPGANGVGCYICDKPNTTGVVDALIATAGTVAQGGAGGLASGNAAGGAGEVLPSAGYLATWAVATATGGQLGANGGAGTPTVGSNINPLSSRTVSAGAGGGGAASGSASAGGNQQNAGLFPILTGGAGNNGSNGGNGPNGPNYTRPDVYFGGAGGGGSATGSAFVGGTGGNGGYGCGGGGGGGGQTFGPGGNGGPGICYIAWW